MKWLQSKGNRLGFLFALLAAAQFACLGAPDRGNPLDPKSDRFRPVGSISGTISQLLAPTALANVVVQLQPGLLITQSDASGRFFFADVPAGKYRVVATLDGYAPATDSVQLASTDSISLNFRLDALPIIDSLAVSSLHVARAFPASHLWLLDTRAYARDPDGPNDLSLMELSIPWLSYTDTLAATSTPGVFEKVIEQGELSLSTLESLIGRRIFVRAQDRVGSSVTSQAARLARVIALTPELLAPTSFELINNPNPTLTWKPVSLPFEYAFLVDVIRSEFNFRATVWTSERIVSGETSVQVGPALSSGNYVWAISVVDDFGNLSRSLEARFQIN